MNTIETYLLNFTSQNTIKNYRSSLKHFFKIIDKDQDTYFKTKQDYKTDVKNFWSNIQTYAPKTRKLKLVAVRGLLEENEIIFPKKFWKKLLQRSKGSKPVTIDRIPTTKEIKQILAHADESIRAITLIAVTSGMRIDEILHIKPDDIDTESNQIKQLNVPGIINIPGLIAKNGDPRTTFISIEAVEALQEWYKVRTKWLKLACARSANLQDKDKNDDRVFPMSYSAFSVKWVRLLKEAGLSEKDKHSGHEKLHFHTTRKFFKTRMLNAGLKEPIINQIIGHEGYLDSEYYRFTLNELADDYIKGLHAVSIYEQAPDLSEVNESLKQKDEQIKTLEDEMQKMKAEILELRLERIEKKNGLK